MDMGLGFLGLFGFIIFMIVGIVKAITRKPAKKSFGLAGVAFVLFIIGLSMTSDSKTETVLESKQEEAKQEEEKIAKEEKAEETKKAEEAKKKEEEKEVANRKKEAAAALAAAELAKKTEEEKQSAEAKIAHGEKATVTRIIDGDTIEVSMNEKEEQIRLLLIDTPETKHPNKPVEKFGPEASAYAEEVLLGQEVHIQEGTESRDKYGRLLAYVWLGDTTYQELILAEGLAVTAYLYNDLTMLDAFHQAQDIARNQQIGVWSIPNYATVDQEHGFNTVVEEKSEQQPVVASTPNATSNQTEYFQNCTELRKVYPKGVPSGHPAYQGKMDRDKDDYACE